MNPADQQKKRFAQVQQIWNELVRSSTKLPTPSLQGVSFQRAISVAPTPTVEPTGGTRGEAGDAPPQSTSTVVYQRSPSEQGPSEKLGGGRKEVESEEVNVSVEVKSQHAHVLECFNDLATILHADESSECCVLVTGSLYLVGAALRILTRPDLGSGTLY